VATLTPAPQAGTTGRALDSGENRRTETSTATRERAQPASDISRPIAEYELLADCNSATRVTRDGSIGWLGLPRYDSLAIFSSGLAGLRASGFSLRVLPAIRSLSSAVIGSGHDRFGQFENRGTCVTNS
jgi:hypothetical protein